MTNIRDTAAFPVPDGQEKPAFRPPQIVQLKWDGERRFDGSRPGGPSARLDASAKTGPSPVDALLLALASCTSVDVLDILEKRRTPVESLVVDVNGTRINAVPARITEIALTYRITGAAIDRVHAERAIDLAVSKYCSVRDTLDPHMPISWELELNGEIGEQCVTTGRGASRSTS